MSLYSTSNNYPLGYGSVSVDFSPAGVSSANDYSTVMNQDMALKIPLGSQLNLLNARNAGNVFLDQMRLSNIPFDAYQMGLKGYNTLAPVQSAGFPVSGNFFMMNQAYSNK